jgi:hypothetical protein
VKGLPPVLGLLVAVAVAVSTGAASAAPVGMPWVYFSVDPSNGPMRRNNSGPDGVDLVDINHDGYLDAVSAWERSNTVRLSMDPGAFVSGVAPFGVDVTNPIGVVGAEDATFADVDGDGNIDVLSAQQAGKRLTVHWAPPAVDLSDAPSWSSEDIPAAAELRKRWIRVKAANVDRRDGLDVVAGTTNHGGIYWFEAPRRPRDIAGWRAHWIGSASWIMSCEPIDMNGDGALDVLYSDRSVVGWFENPGAAKVRDPFVRWKQHLIARQPGNRWVAYADLDRDGLDDVVATANGTADVAIFYRRNDRRGLSWTPYPIRPDQSLSTAKTPNESKGMAVADLDRDGRDELVLTSVGNKSNFVYSLAYGRSPTEHVWRASPISPFQSGAKYDNVQIGDVNDDGRPDVIASDENGRLGLVWFENPYLSGPLAIASPLTVTAPRGWYARAPIALAYSVRNVSSRPIASHAIGVRVAGTSKVVGCAGASGLSIRPGAIFACARTAIFPDAGIPEVWADWQSSDGRWHDGELGAHQTFVLADRTAVVPNPPTNVVALAEDRSAIVTWTPPTSAGASPITGYTVTATPRAAIATGGSDATRAVVHGLRNGVAYVFTVTASNKRGDGAPGPPSAAVIPVSRNG